MSDRVQHVIKLWKEFDLSNYQRDLDKTATEIADRQDASESSRKKLIELSKKFRKESSEEVRSAAADVLKSFQTEIDSLSSRSKAAEVAFLGVYKSLLDLPDPAAAFGHLTALQDRANKVVELETENQRLKARNHEYEEEFQELRNQDVTVKQLREKVKTLETELETAVGLQADEARRKIGEEFEDRERALKENQAILAKKLGESERRVIQLQKALDAAQTEIFESRSKDEVRAQARSEEVELILGDLEKAVHRAAAAEKQVEELKAALEEVKGPVGDSEDANVTSSSGDLAELTRTVKNLQIELSAKDKDMERLVEEVAKTKNALESQCRQLSSDLSNATLELAVTKRALESAESQLKEREDYEDLKKEITTFRSVEFGAMAENDGGNKSLEVLVMEKNKALQNEMTALKVKYADMTSKTSHLTMENERLSQVVADQGGLIAKLEKDLSDIQSVTALCRGEGEGQPAAAEWVFEAVSDLGAPPEPPGSPLSSSRLGMDPATAAENLLPIVSAQRERFKERNQELEARNSQLLEQMTLLQVEVESLRGDNLKLYEKIRFLQSYSSSSSSTSVSVNTPAEDRYSSQYEAKLDPFAFFSRREQMRKYSNLSPYEKFTLGMGRAILSNKTARLMTLVYTFLLHGLVVLVLYKLAYTEECRQDAAADCMKRFAEHMSSVHKENVHNH